MKTIKIYTLLSALLTISLFSCDIVDEPFMVQKEVCDDCEEFVFNNPTTPTKKVLLEDYTGHTCGNCPRAAEKAHELKELHGDNLIVLGVHAGFFSNPTNDYPTNFQTDAGSDWDTHFGNSIAGNPNGHVNRVNFPEGAHIYQYSEWGQIIEEQLQTPPSVGIQIMAGYNESANLICVDTKTQILEEFDGDLNITVLVTESNIIAKQKDYSLDEGYVEEYEHNHVLRKSLNGSWGESLGQESYEANDTFIYRTCTQVSSEWNVNNMSVIAFVSNPETFEILQVEEIHLTH